LFTFRRRCEIKNRFENDANGQLIGDDPKIKILSFLFTSYKPEYWYFEIVETSRRLIIISVLSTISPGTSTQTIVGIAISLISLKLYGYLRPYYLEQIETLAEYGMNSKFLMFLGLLIIQNKLVGESVNSAIGVFMILNTLTVVLLPVYYEWRDRQKASPEAQTDIELATIYGEEGTIKEKKDENHVMASTSVTTIHSTENPLLRTGAAMSVKDNSASDDKARTVALQMERNYEDGL
jgi:hypothetical protein